MYIYTDSGRLTRPVYYKDSDGKLSYNHGNIRDTILSHQYSWTQVVAGFEEKKTDNFSVRRNILYDANELYPGYKSLDRLLDMLQENKGIIDYLDTSETETAFIATRPDQIKDNKFYTHSEIDPSLMFGVMGNSIIYPETNQLPRDVFSCGQSKQAVSMYHSNYQMRMDKMGVILNYGQVPLIKSRYLKYINNEEQPYGVNAIVAIMSYTGYNVEDAILINEGSINRGLFRTTYYTTYEAREESSRVSGGNTNSFFTNIDAKQNVSRLKEGFDYSKLDDHGLIKENAEINDRVVLIGQVSTTTENKGEYADGSKTTKKGQLGFVDKSFISEGEEGFRIAKIRVREERLPAIGDKMASRGGQKGTLGLIVPEEDMPFTADGVRPDLIINPHALPSRMTIGQLIECMLGKTCALYGGYGDCTAYSTKGANYDTYGPMLTKMGYHNSGNQILYNGYTGEQLYSEIFIGPTYYMRLKHMVKDKINYRATGKRSALTRQTNQGRANDGGLRIGEMERDGIMAHGLSYFLNESYMIRGDEYYMAVCNKTGAIAVYNSERNLFLSPFSDGPLMFSNSKEGQPVLDAFSVYGRSFSILRIPYALKLLIQELQVMNVQMRIITEENVDQLLNLSYQSQNIDKLLGIDHGEDGLANREISEIIENYKKQTIAKAKANGNSGGLNIDREGLTESPQSLEQGENSGSENTIENTAFRIGEDVVVKNEETREKFHAVINKVYMNGQGNEMYNVVYDNGELERDVNSSRITLYNQTPLYVEQTSVYSPHSPVETPPESLTNSLQNSVQNSIESLDNALGEIGSSVSNSLSSAADAVTNKIGSISDVISGESQLDIFDDPQMNDIFNKLSTDKKAAIIKMDEEQRKSVMSQIMAATQQAQQTSSQSGGGLSSYFNGLPIQNQIAALQNTYKSMANEFKQLSGAVNAPQITILKPQSAAEALYGSTLSLFAPDSGVKKGGSSSSDKDDKTEIPSSSSSSSSSSSNQSGGYVVKKI